MQAIVCVSENWGIGRDGRLLFRLSADLKRFRALTTGKTVILGSRTLATFPGGTPLPERRNVVLTRSETPIEGAELAHTVEDALALAGDNAVVIPFFQSRFSSLAFEFHVSAVKVGKHRMLVQQPREKQQKRRRQQNQGRPP